MEEILQQILAELKNVNTRLGGVESRLDGVESRLDGVESRLSRVESRLDGVESGQKEIYQILRALEARTDEHGALLNRILQDMDYMKGDIKSLQEGQASLVRQMVETKREVDDLSAGQRYTMQKINEHDVAIFKLREAVLKHVSGL